MYVTYFILIDFCYYCLSFAFFSCNILFVYIDFIDHLPKQSIEYFFCQFVKDLVHFITIQLFICLFNFFSLSLTLMMNVQHKKRSEFIISVEVRDQDFSYEKMKMNKHTIDKLKENLISLSKIYSWYFEYINS